VEGLRANLKGVELANLTADALDDIVAAAERGIQRIRATDALAYSLLRHCGLSLWLDPSGEHLHHLLAGGVSISACAVRVGGERRIPGRPRNRSVVQPSPPSESKEACNGSNRCDEPCDA
jgi:hypothetical protein